MLRYIIPVLVALLFSGCNNDIFVEDTTVSESSLTIAGDGGEVSVRIQRSGLQWYGLDVTGSNYPVTCYNRKGDEIPSDSPASEMARINYKSVDLWFDITLDGNELKIKSTENAGLLKIRFAIKLEYGFKNEYIHVVVEPGKLMEFESIIYDWSEMTVDPAVQTEKGTITYINGGQSNYHLDFHPFLNAVASVLYDPEKSWADYLDANVRVPVLTENGWSLGEEKKVRLTTKNTFVPTNIDREVSIPLDIPPGDSIKVSNYIKYRSMKVPFDITYRNPVSGRSSTTPGICTAKEPIDYEVRINE